MDLDVKCYSSNLDQPLLSTRKTVAATPITNFYSGKTVFVTGGTGFLGTVLIGKLLTTCDVKRVYMIIKPKNEDSIEKRLTEFIKSPAFDEVRKNNISALDKVVPVSGNIREEQLGMCAEDVATMCAEVQVVFHIAANINMGSDLKDTLEVNTKATAKLVAFCKGMQQLRVFLYVSTAYSHCQRRLIDEKVYEPGTSIEAVYDISENQQGGKILNVQRNYLMENRPNAYSFSKSLAEKIVEEDCHGIPSVIVRPSTITSSLRFPKPGWTSQLSAQSRHVLAVADGFLRCMAADPDSLIDLVPVDQVANLIIASVWDADKHRSERVKVFNCCSGLRNPITLGKYIHSGDRFARKHSCTAIFSRFVIMVKNRIVFNILWFFLQTFPAYVLDTLLFWRKPRMATINANLARMMAVTKYFRFTDFTFIDHNTRRLLADMDPRDQTLFDIDFGSIDWEKYLDIYVFGLQKYLRRK